ncbi:hypothetical protein QTH91_09940 [Variovorax dokdonensis]|uniref:Heme-binding protein n=1 Tax=Variovorax dokdonensis TaxID=344883 RepID=A0ABT7NA37_9BURK|nr:hypothetical protein [Variovorax dokdonensis]MDM0044803.1 hypothetical protein [Variovorax dokdonensis]
MPDKTRIAAVLLFGVLWSGIQVCAAEPSVQGPRANVDAALSAAHESVLQIQLVDGSVLAVEADDSISSAVDGDVRTRSALRAGTAPGPQVPQALMRRRGQIFDPATPGVVASIRG